VRVAIAGARIFGQRRRVIGLGDIVGEVIQVAAEGAAEAIHRKWGVAGCAAVLLGMVAIIGFVVWCFTG
jgi:hypothetical protein